MFSVNRIIADWVDRSSVEGLIRRARFVPSVNSKANILEIKLHDRRKLLYTLTDHELRMGGRQAVECWLDTIERDIRNTQINAAIGSGYQQAQSQQNSASYNQQLAWSQIDLTPQQIAMLQQQYAQPWNPSYQQSSDVIGNDFARQYLPSWDLSREKDATAQKKSEELFLLTCGKESFDTLNSGKPLPLTGSEGTKYTLHKRASYCVERVSDGARLCAVVPGVPLWDHPLGIKLMIEHDEPKFIETANVSNVAINLYSTPRWQNSFFETSFLRGIGVLGNCVA